jgi:hypothetical protein
VVETELLRPFLEHQLHTQEVAAVLSVEQEVLEVVEQEERQERQQGLRGLQTLEEAVVGQELEALQQH